MKKRLTVAFGDIIPEVLDFTVRDFGRLALDVEEMEDMKTTKFVADENDFLVAGEHEYTQDMINIIECLNDHINNVPEEELCERLAEDDYHCANPEHVRTNAECYCSQKDCMAVTVYEYTYNGPNCVVTCYYVKEAE